MNGEPSGRGVQTDAQRLELALALPNCPYEETNPQACPLRDIRDKNLRERVAWLDAVSDEAIQNIYTFCRLCWKAKENLKRQDHT
jgi:hypothetical protein